MTADTVELFVEYEYYDEVSNRDSIGGVRFVGTAAFKFDREPYSSAECVSAYDCVMEVPNSPWLKQLLELESPHQLGSAKDSRHFAMYLSNNGCLEVIAETVEVVEARPGRLRR